MAGVKKILVLTLMHPDFLPPVYATSQVLRDQGFAIDILCFDSIKPAPFNVGPSITLISAGKYHDEDNLTKYKLRRKYLKMARSMAKQPDTVAVISFSNFSFLIGEKIRGTLPHIYLALEIANYNYSLLRISPLTAVRNFLAFKKIKKATIVGTPSVQRSSWLAGRAGLSYVPATVLNTAYYTPIHQSTFEGEKLIPVEMRDRKKLIYTGNVNEQNCVLEVVKAFDRISDERVLIVTGIKENEYCQRIVDFVKRSAKSSCYLLLPVVTRNQMLSLQALADVGICFTKVRDNICPQLSAMIAPNKVGEYISKGLLVIGNSLEYMKQFDRNIAVLTDTIEEEQIAWAMEEAFGRVEKPHAKQQVFRFFRDEFCMQSQLFPITHYLRSLAPHISSQPVETAYPYIKII